MAARRTPVFPETQATIDKLLTVLRTLPEPERRLLHDGLTQMNQEMIHNYKQHVDAGPGEIQSGTGGATGRGEPIPERVVGSVEYEVDPLSCPSQRVTYTRWARPSERFVLGNAGSVNLSSIHGKIEVQSLQDQTQPTYEFIVNAVKISGNAVVPRNALVAFNVGFARFDAIRGKFFIDTSAFIQETTNPLPAQMVNWVPVTGLGARFVSSDVILSDPLIAAYDRPHGGAGLRFRCSLTIYGR